MSSNTCLNECLFPYRPDGSTVNHHLLTDIFPTLSQADVQRHVTGLDDSSCHHDFTGSKSIDGRMTSLDVGERTLLAVVDNHPTNGGCLVIEDEEAHDVINAFLYDGESSVFPISSLTFWRRLYQCLALTAQWIEILCAGFKHDLETRRSGMGSNKLEKKHRDLDELLNHVALRETELALS